MYICVWISFCSSSRPRLCGCILGLQSELQKAPEVGLHPHSNCLNPLLSFLIKSVLCQNTRLSPWISPACYRSLVAPWKCLLSKASSLQPPVKLLHTKPDHFFSYIHGALININKMAKGTGTLQRKGCGKAQPTDAHRASLNKMNIYTGKR